jgi:hypothetical protein
MPMTTADPPRDELAGYAGTNPRPADFDAFWAAGLAELDGLDPQVKVEPAEFQTPFAECLHLWFRGTAGGPKTSAGSPAGRWRDTSSAVFYPDHEHEELPGHADIIFAFLSQL